MPMILTEDLTFKQANIIVERSEEQNTNGEKKLYLSGLMIQGGVRNLNQRIYPDNEIRKAVREINEQLDAGSAILSELDHPEELTVNLDRVCGNIIQLKYEDGCGFGKMQILPTPCGNIVTTLVEAGVSLGVSSRGSGNVDSNGMVSEFEIITIDVVAKPSCKKATPKPVYESLQTKRGRIIADLAEAVSHDPKAQKHLYTEVLNWINKF